MAVYPRHQSNYLDLLSLPVTAQAVTEAEAMCCGAREATVSPGSGSGERERRERKVSLKLGVRVSSLSKLPPPTLPGHWPASECMKQAPETNTTPDTDFNQRMTTS